MIPSKILIVCSMERHAISSVFASGLWYGRVQKSARPVSVASEGREIKTRRKTYLYSTEKFACLPNNSVACSRLLFGLEKTKEPMVEEMLAPNLGAEEVAAASDVEPGARLSEFPSREDAQGPILLAYLVCLATSTMAHRSERLRIKEDSLLPRH